MTTDSHLAAARPLLVWAAWLLLFIIAAFGWAAIESRYGDGLDAAEQAEAPSN